MKNLNIQINDIAAIKLLADQRWRISSPPNTK